MSKKFILATLVGVLLIAAGTTYALKHEAINKDLVKSLTLTNQIKGTSKAQVLGSSIYKDGSSETISETSQLEELNNQLAVVERYMKENKVLEQLKKNDIDPGEQSRYFQAIIEKQKILEKIVNIEIEKSNKLLASIKN